MLFFLLYHSLVHLTRSSDSKAFPDSLRFALLHACIDTVIRGHDEWQDKSLRRAVMFGSFADR